MGEGENAKLTVEFFGPFREFGKGLELPLIEDIGFEELVSRLEERFGESFTQRAHMRNTTYILNNRVIDRKGIGTIRISAGDRFAFALVIGGG